MAFLKWVIAGLVAVGAVLGAFSFFSGGHAFGSPGQGSETYPNSQWLVGGNQIGPTGTLNANSQFGACNLIGTGKTLAATSTGNYDCAVSGILPGDFVLADAPSGFTAGTLGAIYPIAAHASTTAGYITFTLVNLSGAASTTLGQPVASGTEYFTWR